MTGTPGAPVRVLVVDDQTLVRESLTGLLGLLAGTEVVGAAWMRPCEGGISPRDRPDAALPVLRLP